MSQYAYPDNDDSNPGGWSPSTGSTLFGVLDEVSADDADFIYLQGTTGYCEVGLSTVTDPGVDTGHILRYRLRRSNAAKNCTLVITLYDGATSIASWTHVNPSTAYALFERTLTEEQAGNISSGGYGGDLKVRIDATVNQNPGIAEFSWTRLEVPDAAGDVNVTPPPASLTITGKAPVAALGPLTVTMAVAALAINTFAPTVALGPLEVSPAPTACTITGKAPTASLGPLTITPPPCSLTITGKVPIAGVLAPLQLSDSTYIGAGGAPTTAQLEPPSGKTTGDFTAGRIQDDENPADPVNIGSGGYTEFEWAFEATGIASGTYELRITADGTPLDGYTVTPEVTIATVAQVPPCDLTISGHAPAVALGPLTVTPAPAALTLTGYAPTVDTSADVDVTPAPCALTITGKVPAVALGPFAATPNVSALAIAGWAPIVDITASQTITPAPCALIVTGYAPSLGAPVTITPAPCALTVAGHAPSLTLTVTPPPCGLTITGKAPSTAVGITVAPCELSLTGYAPELGGLVTAITPAPCELAVTAYAPITRWIQLDLPLTVEFTEHDRTITPTEQERTADFTAHDRTITPTEQERVAEFTAQDRTIDI